MFGECHAHALMNGINYRAAVNLHREGANEQACLLYTSPLTTDEVAEIAEKCTTDDYVGTHIIMDHGEGLPYALEPLYLSAGKDYISEDGKEADGYVNSEEAVNLSLIHISSQSSTCWFCIF